jgi:hypothetical protein
MYLCYIDESGTSDIPGNTSHFILAGLSIPIWHWRIYDSAIETIKKKYGLENSEIHIAWMLRPYFEQKQITNFDTLDYRQRRSQVESLRNAELLRLQRVGNPSLYKQTKKNFRKTEDYIHLSYDERLRFIHEIAYCISQWGSARLFAECIDKIYFNPSLAKKTIDEQAFEQVISRFEQYLHVIDRSAAIGPFGLLIHDNNQTVASKHTKLMRKFHQSGTLWTQIENTIETPLFVDSQLTSMVQIADVCAYSLRRYVENGDNDLFDFVFQRADRKDGIVVGVRHFTNSSCRCKICTAHRIALTP